jgi:hypothetical protein
MIGVLISLLCIILSILVSVIIFEMSWNYVIPQVFRLKRISFKESFALIIVISMISSIITGDPLVISYIPDVHTRH